MNIKVKTSNFHSLKYELSLPRVLFLFLILIRLWHDFKIIWNYSKRIQRWFEPTTFELRFFFLWLSALFRGSDSFRDFSLALLISSDFFSPILWEQPKIFWISTLFEHYNRTEATNVYKEEKQWASNTPKCVLVASTVLA